MKTDSLSNVAHHERVRSPKTFSQPCNTNKADEATVSLHGALRPIALLLPVSHWRQNIKQEKAQSLSEGFSISSPPTSLFVFKGWKRAR